MRTLILASLTVFAGLSIMLVARAGNDSSSVRIQVIQCPPGELEPPRLFTAAAANYPKLQYRLSPVAAISVSKGYYEFATMMPSGNYFFKTESTSCTNYLQAGILAGRSRVLSIPLVRRILKSPFEGHVKLFDEENVLAGTIPLRPQVAYLVAEGGGKRILDLQDGGYYIERIPPGKYTVRMEFHGGFQSEIPVDLTTIAPTEFVERNFDVSQVRRHLGNILPSGATLEKCDWCS